MPPVDPRRTQEAIQSPFGFFSVEKMLMGVKSSPAFYLLLLLPAVFLLHPIAIDETRYLSVAWEMRLSSDFLVPHLNGDWYSDKPPLLFWLINLAWDLTGVSTWGARLVTVACSALNLVLLGKVSRQLGLDGRTARNAQWLLAGTFYFAVFSTAIMFDVLLLTCVLAAVSGLLHIVAEERRRGMAWTTLAVAAGILAKGPVMLLDIVFAIMLLPWLNAANRGQLRAWFGAIAISLVAGVTLALGWAIPAAIAGGADYTHSLFFHQTLDRMASSFAHERPVWWYVLVFPTMLLPWALSLRPTSGVLRFAYHDRACQFSLLWIAPTLLVFSLIGSKQPHYLLPLLPGAGILAATLYSHGYCVPRRGVFALLVIAIGIALGLAGTLANASAWLAPFVSVSPWWGVAVCALAIVFLITRRRVAFIPAATFVSLVTVALTYCAISTPLNENEDVTAIAAIIRAAQDSQRSVVHLGRHYGLYEYAGRLTKPLAIITTADLPAWCDKHRDGLIVAMDGNLQLDAPALYSKPFRDARAGVWRASDAIGAHVVEIRPNRRPE